MNVRSIFHLFNTTFQFTNFNVYSLTCIFYYIGEILTSGVTSHFEE